MAEHLRDIVDNVHVLSMADIVAPAYAGPCLNPDLLSLTRTPNGMSGIRAEDGTPQLLGKAWTSPGLAGRVRAQLGALVKPFDPSARILVGGLAGFVAVFVAEVAGDHGRSGDLSLVDAFYSMAKVTVTVGPEPGGGDRARLVQAVLRRDHAAHARLRGGADRRVGEPAASTGG